jgi:hypothetical protein
VRANAADASTAAPLRIRRVDSGHAERPHHAVARRQRRGHHQAEAVDVTRPATDPVGDLGYGRRPAADRIRQVADRQRRRMRRDPGSDADEVRCERPSRLVAPDDHDMVGAGRAAELLGDRVDDGVGIHRP